MSCTVQHCPGLQRKRRRAFRQIAVSSKRRDARVASPHNTQRAACSHPVPGNTHICPRRRVVPCREERRVFRLSLAALPSELGKGEEHTQSVLSQEDDGQRCWLRHSRRALRRSPHEDVEQVVDSSDASRDRERESRSSFARRPSISMQQHRERARKAQHRKGRRQGRVNGNYQVTPGHSSKAFISMNFSGVVRF